MMLPLPGREYAARWVLGTSPRMTSVGRLRLGKQRDGEERTGHHCARQIARFLSNAPARHPLNGHPRTCSEDPAIREGEALGGEQHRATFEPSAQGRASVREPQLRCAGISLPGS